MGLDKEVNYILYTVDYCQYCNDAISLMNDYAADTGITYDIVKAHILIEKVPEAEGIVKKSFVLYNEDKTERFDLPAVPALWIRDRNELVIGTDAIEYLKKVNTNG